MNDSDDLTRWNRSGLKRFRYVDGTAVEHLETLRAELARRFPGWQAIAQQGSAAATSVAGQDEESQRLARILDQYHGPRRDFAWEIVRALARACHVLTEHLDAYANEGYLETATQWDNVRRLVLLLGYHPAPPASAATWLVLAGKPGARGVVERGFQVKHSPVDGAAPVTFETLQDLPIDDRLNTLRLAGWNRSEASFDPFATALSPWRCAREMEISVGQPVVVLQEAGERLPGTPSAPDVSLHASACAIVKQNDTEGFVCIGPQSGAPDWKKGHTRLLAGPKKAWRPRLNGPERVGFDRDHGLAAGDVVAWLIDGVWVFNTVKAAEARAITLVEGSCPPLNASVFKTGMVPTPPAANGLAGELRLPLDLEAAVRRGSAGWLEPLNVGDTFVTHQEAGTPTYKVVAPSVSPPVLPPIFILRGARTPAGQVVELASPAGRFTFDGSPAGLASGMWVVAEEAADAAGQALRSAARIERIEALEGCFTLTLGAASPAAGQMSSDTLADLQKRLHQVAVALDQEVFSALTLRELVGDLKNTRETSAIKGVGPGGYAPLLAARKLRSIGELAEMNTVRPVPGVSPLRLQEFQTKAQMVSEFRFDIDASDPLLDSTLDQILAIPPTGGVRTSVASVQALVRLERLYGPMRYTLWPAGHDSNDDAVVPEQITLALDADPETGRYPEALRKGRRLLIERQMTAAGLVDARQAVIDSIDGNRIFLTPPLPDFKDFTLGNTVINANVVPAGHGEVKAEKLLGSGNAAQLNQEFLLAVPSVSSVADSSMPSGVRADLAIIVDGQTWQQVGSLTDSRPVDAHYTIRVTEEGMLRIGFGDGSKGRRLPTGSNNVRVTYRVGSGLAGNLPVGSLKQAARPHRLIASVRQPQEATGGNDMESVAALRATAPASLLTLERAVSLADFANLAASQASVLQARALSHTRSQGRQARVEVVVVPASGATLDEHAHTVNLEPLRHFLAQQASFLQEHALPGTRVTIRLYEPILVDLVVSVAIKSAEYDVESTLDAVRAALRAVLALSRRRLGQALHRSELYQAVELVKGVENSDCRMSLVPGTGATPQPLHVLPSCSPATQPVETIVPGERQVIYLDERFSTIRLTMQEFVL